MSKTPTDQFLNWIADRLVHVYGEREHVSFVNRLREIAAEANLAEAWAEAEAEVKRTMGDQWVVTVQGLAHGYEAAITTPNFRNGSFDRSDHETPAAALRALTAKMKEVADGS